MQKVFTCVTVQGDLLELNRVFKHFKLWGLEHEITATGEVPREDYLCECCCNCRKLRGKK